MQAARRRPDYVLKPFAPEVLKAKVSAFVDLYKTTREVRRQAELLRQANRELENEIAERRKAEEALRQIHEELESRVERRTAQLARDNAELDEQSAERLRADHERTLLQEEIIRMQGAMLGELSTPLIPLSDGVVIMPLVGTIDSKRAEQVLAVIAQGVVARGARIDIIDITGVPTGDTHVASVMLRAAQAVRLLGAEVVLTGIRSKVARSLVELGGLNTRRNLLAGITYARAHL